uniref:serotriflin-like n=1 Tax=Euleptes europaea TaxID=460621 RepID=UPI00254001DF|nr:serotriflin-like [Euleptes europaea]
MTGSEDSRAGLQWTSLIRVQENLRDEQDFWDDEGEDEKDDDDLSTGSGVPLKSQKEIVDKHNEIRRNVQPTARNMLKMTWNETVGVNSRKWGDKCQMKSSPLEDRTLDGVLCGQSMFQSNYPYSWTEVIDYWKNKAHYFKYGVGSIDPEQNIYGYTQVIWYRSYQIGCSVSVCPNNKHTYVYICQYCPTGNIEHLIKTPYKEGPSCGDCPKHCEDKLCTNPCMYLDQSLHCAELKKMLGCKKANKNGHCNATCKCSNKIK